MSLRRCGKPALVYPTAERSLRFNVSHSSERVLIALTRGREVGVDIERVVPDMEVDELRGAVLSASEQAQLRHLPPSSRTAASFDCWVRKEADIKATGHGLSVPLQSFSVSLEPHESGRVTLDVRDRPGEALRWSIRSVFVGRAYAAAVAVEASDFMVSGWDFDHAAWLPAHREVRA